jgi:4-amino-4-deoxy-L-arabinose transferase-like glycosyltransferase
MLIRHIRFIGLLALFVLATVLHQRLLPVMEGSDEILHVNYVELLLAENRLPDRATRDTNSTQQASGQPPLAYWTASVYARLLHLPILDDDALREHVEVTVRNRWFQPHRLWERYDNHSIYYHGLNETAFEWQDAARINQQLRLMGLFWGVAAMIGAYGAALTLFPQRRWALVATALFAFMPTFIHGSSYFNNDAPAVAFAALTTWQTLRLLRDGASASRLLLIGLLIGLGTLSKVNTLLIAPAVGLAVLLEGYERRRSLGRVLLNGMLMLLPLALVTLPWLLYGWLNYGDPFGFNTHRHLTENFYFEEPRSLPEIIPFFPHLYLSYWAWFTNVLLHPVTYTAFGLILVLSLAGYALGRKLTRWSSLRREQAFVLALMFAAVLAGMIRWMQQLAFTGGRLMYPAHVAVVLALTGGLYLLARCFPRLDFFLRALPTTIIVVAGLILTPVALHEAYGVPPLLDRAQLPALQGGPVDFDDTIRLLGFTQQDWVIREPWHPVTLCWEVLKAAERPAAFSIKFVHDGVTYADRTSVFGMGRFHSALWKPGDVFCDSFGVPIDDPDIQEEEPPLVSGQVYDIIVVVLDARTLAVDWAAKTPDGTPIAYPFVGQVIAS